MISYIYKMSEQIVRVGNHNVGVSQSLMVKNLNHSIINVPSTSSPSFGGYFIFDLKNKGIKVHELTMQFVTSGIQELSGGNPLFTPGENFINRIEILIGGTVISTIYGLQLFLMNQIWRNDEGRKVTNQGSGDYVDREQRITYTSQPGQSIEVSLKTLFNQTHYNLLSQSHEIQLKIYTNTVANIVELNGATGTPSSQLLSANLIARVTYLDDASAQNQVQFLTKQPRSYFFHETRLATLNVASGVSSTTQILTSITQNVAVLFFVVQKTNQTAGSGFYNYERIKDWNLLDANGSSLVGGSSIVRRLSNQLFKMWSQSSYIADVELDTFPYSHVYMWSFSADPITAHSTGQQLGSHVFRGNESLVINFDSALSDPVTITVYSLNDAALVQTMNTCQKITSF